MVPSLTSHGPSSTDPVTTSGDVKNEEPGTTVEPDNATREVDAVVVGDRDLGAAAVEADQLDPEEEKTLRSRVGRGRNRRIRPVPQAPPPATGSDPSDPVIASRPVPAAPEASTAGEGRPVPLAPEPTNVPPVTLPPRGRPPLRPPAAATTTSTAGTAGRNMPIAIVSGVVLAVVALIAFKIGTVATMVLVSIVIVLAAGEAFGAFRRAHYHPAVLLGLLGTLVLAIETYNKGVAAFPLTMVVLVVASFLWFIFGVEGDADPVAGMSSTVFVFVWIAGFGSFAALLLCPSLFPNRTGIAFLLGAIIVTVCSDVGSLLVGSQFGKRPMAPHISPNKSWEGFVGGAVLSVLGAVVVVQFIHPWTFKSAATLGLVAAIVSPLGDLCESLLKRHLGLKDMSQLLPGHGGLLDRLDGLLFVLPATYFLVRAFNLG
jgi:CDP-diglyceride synthetase